MKKIFLSLAIVSMVGSSFAQGVLKFTPKVGTKIIQKLSANTEMSMNGEDMSSVIKTYGHVEVVKAENGVSTLKAVTDSFIMNMNTPDGPQTINSNDGDANAMPQLAPLLENVGKEIVFLVDENGKVVSDNAAELSELTKLTLIEFQKPDKNKSWSNEMETKVQGMKMKVKTKYSLGKVTNDEVTINAVTVVNMMIKKIEAPTTYILDAKSGIVKSATTIMEMDMMGMSMKTTSTYQATIQ